MPANRLLARGVPFFCGPAALLAAWFLAGAVLPATEALAADGDTKIPDPKELTITTADGVRLAVTYYAGTKEKETVPVILLHDSKGSGSDYGELASSLQEQGHAVLVPDLRCHGASATSDNPRSAPNAARRPATYLGMASLDMPALKEFLRQENNKGKLNLEKLCVVGAGVGASVAWNWAFLDWSRPPVGTVKLGQDVKALVLISPDAKTPRLPMKVPRQVLTPPLTDPLLMQANVFKYPRVLDPRREIAVLIVAGKGNPRSAQDARRLHAMLEPFHPAPSGDADARGRDLFLGMLNTSLQGTTLLEIKGLNLERHISKFIEVCLTTKSVPWQKRTNDPYARER